MHAEVTNRIIPDCYSAMLFEAGPEMIDDMPSYEELLSMLDLKTVCINTVYKWIKDLGFHYDVNKRCYYTDGHERSDVVEDREDRFLDSYFNYEIQSHRWVQLIELDAIQLEKIGIGTSI